MASYNNYNDGNDSSAGTNSLAPDSSNTIQNYPAFPISRSASPSLPLPSSSSKSRQYSLSLDIPATKNAYARISQIAPVLPLSPLKSSTEETHPNIYQQQDELEENQEEGKPINPFLNSPLSFHQSQPSTSEFQFQQEEINPSLDGSHPSYSLTPDPSDSSSSINDMNSNNNNYASPSQSPDINIYTGQKLPPTPWKDDDDCDQDPSSTLGSSVSSSPFKLNKNKNMASNTSILPHSPISPTYNNTSPGKSQQANKMLTPILTADLQRTPSAPEPFSINKITAQSAKLSINTSINSAAQQRTPKQYAPVLERSQSASATSLGLHPAPSFTSSTNSSSDCLASPTSVYSRHGSVSNELDPISAELSAIHVKQNSGAWHEDWNISEEVLAELPEDVIKFQSELHNFIQQEENYVNGLKVFFLVFKGDKPIHVVIDNQINRDLLVKTLFDPLKPILELNKTLLLKPFLDLQAQGREKNNPYLQFNAQAVADWLQNIKEPFSQFAKLSISADYIIKEQKATNDRFKNLINSLNSQAKKHSNKDFDSLMHSTRTRFGLYTSHFNQLLKLIRRNEGEPRICSGDVQKTINLIEECTKRCNALMAEYDHFQRVEGNILEMSLMERRLNFKRDQDKINFALSAQNGRPPHEKILEKEIFRKSSFEPATVLLFDHMLVIVKKIKYDDWKILEPIAHLELLRIESLEEPAQLKKSDQLAAAVRKHSTNNSRVNGGVKNFQSQLGSIDTKNSISPSRSISNFTVSELTSVQSAPSANSSNHPSSPSSPDSSFVNHSPSMGSSSSVTTPTLDSFPPSPQLEQKPSPQSQLNLTPTPSLSTPLRPTNSLVVDLAKSNKYADKKSFFPVRFTNLKTGKQLKFYFQTRQDRKNFSDNLISAKEQYRLKAFHECRVPLGLKVLDQSSFPLGMGIDPNYTNSPSNYVGGDAVDRALNMYPKDSPSKKPFVASTVNCAFDMVVSNETLTFLGSNSGLFGARHVTSPSGEEAPLVWKQISNEPCITQIEGHEKPNVLFILTNSQLMYLKLNEVVLFLLSPDGKMQIPITKPQLIAENIDCFKTGYFNGKLMLFFSSSSMAVDKSEVTCYEVALKPKHDGKSKSFKSMFKSREAKPYDEFLHKPISHDSHLFSPTKVHSFAIFDTFFFFLTAKTFDFLNVRLVSQEVPTTKSIANSFKASGFSPADGDNFKSALADARPVAVGRMITGTKTPKNGNREFPNLIHCFNKFAVMSVRNGDLYVPNSSESVPLEAFRITYMNKIDRAYIWYPYLLVFSPNVVEVRLLTVKNFSKSLVQVITGRNIRLLTGASTHEESLEVKKDANPVNAIAKDRIIMAMDHPLRKTQLILEFTRNPDVKSDDLHLVSDLTEFGC